MIDLHCHILPGVDDGALDLRDSLGMARQAVGDGIERVCATPHIRHDHDVRIGELAERVAALNAALAGEGLPLSVLGGGEVAETAVEGLTEEELRLVGLGAGEWVLLEPAPGPLGDTLLRRVAHLAERGRRALIAHPERHLSADMGERAPPSSSRSRAARVRSGVSTGPRTNLASSQSLSLTRSGSPARALCRRGGERSTTTGVPLARTSATRLP